MKEQGLTFAGILAEFFKIPVFKAIKKKIPEALELSSAPGIVILLYPRQGDSGTPHINLLI